jgi:hypothetical protein
MISSVDQLFPIAVQSESIKKLKYLKYPSITTSKITERHVIKPRNLPELLFIAVLPTYVTTIAAIMHSKNL